MIIDFLIIIQSNMTFVSLEFLVLFAFTALLTKYFTKIQQRQAILLGASYVFYAYWDVRFLGLLILQTFISFFLGIKISKTDVATEKKRYCVLGVVASLVILGFFKYFNFFLISINDILHVNNSCALTVILPIGISFYTFQAMSYLIDVYRGKFPAREHFLQVSLYIAFFPQLVAGPIVRASDFLPQLDENHGIKLRNVEQAVQIFVMGLFKKVVIADRLAVCVDAVFAAPSAYDAPSIICAVVAYSIQIYCDFSGYSDMAIGVAKFFGYDLCKNFDIPYISQNPTEFWKRWHISLSSWLKDYLYIPLGGNRKGTKRRYLNLFLTMLLGGLWHGANWTFVIWGMLHGIALVVHKLFLDVKESLRFKQENHLKPIITVLSILITYIFVCICWIFFRAQNLREALVILQRIIVWQSGVHYIYIYTIIFGFVVFFAHIYCLINNKGKGFYIILPLKKFWCKLIFCCFLWVIWIFSYVGDTAFVYFQF